MGSMSSSKYSYSMLNSTTNYIQNILTIKGDRLLLWWCFLSPKAVAVFKNKVLKLPDYTVYFTNSTNMQS